MYQLLIANPLVTSDNQSVIVETLRSVAETVIWGDQNDENVFDYFLEKDMITFFDKAWACCSARRWLTWGRF